MKEQGFPGALANFLSTDDLAGLASEEPHLGKHAFMYLFKFEKTLSEEKWERSTEEEWT